MTPKFLGFQTFCLLAGLAELAFTAEYPNGTEVDFELLPGAKNNPYGPEYKVEESARISNGWTADYGEYPYMASMRVNNAHHCGGAIISHIHVLTAAHCIVPHVRNPNSRVSVVTGTNHIRNGGVHHIVIWMYYHPQYRANNARLYDVGVLKLRYPIVYNRLQTSIAIANTWTPVNSIARVSGWGVTENGQLSVWLQKLNLRILSNNECSRRVGSPVHNSIMCTHQENYQSVCMGDSGSPVVYNGQVIGLVSGGFGCGSGKPDLHTNVYLHRDYINNILREA